MKELFEMLISKGGKIVSSANCSTLEIAEAGACKRMWVDENGFGFIWFPQS
jgi:hypothetical protein